MKYHWILHISVAITLRLCLGKKSTDEGQAQLWFNAYNARSQHEYEQSNLASWDYSTNLTDYNSQRSVAASGKLAKFNKDTYNNVTKMFDWSGFQNATLKRLFNKITDIGNAVLSSEDNTRLNTIVNRLDGLHSTGQVCCERCYKLEDLSKIMASSSDWNQQLWAWKGWRDASGKKMKDLYVENIALLNKAARMNGHGDAGNYWRKGYETENFEQVCENLWKQVKPLYQQLHAYVRRKLVKVYKNHEFPQTRQIPAHILGNMWAQGWENIMDKVKPYNKPILDVTDAMKQQNYTVERIIKTSEDFFTSLGLPAMPGPFWNHSMFVRPADREVECHASAWDFYNQKDFRIKQCTEISMDWLMTTHHEMGHIAYYQQYKLQPVAFRDGANAGFHEAVGDILSLSASTPEHLSLLNLVPDNITVMNDNETDLNFLLRQALSNIAFLPFGYLIDKWRWSVFAGETTKEDYNRKWWEFRCKYQGVSPPVPRTEEDFDPGSKSHIPGNTPYIRYFISTIIQFQFHKALCEAAGNTRPLHRCDIYNSTAAGKKLSDMLKMGSRYKWPEAMEAITGQRQMNASGLMEYYEPLRVWLEKQNQGQDITWEENCPSGSIPPTRPPPTPTSASSRTMVDKLMNISMAIFAFLLGRICRI